MPPRLVKCLAKIGVKEIHSYPGKDVTTPQTQSATETCGNARQV